MPVQRHEILMTNVVILPKTLILEKRYSHKEKEILSVLITSRRVLQIKRVQRLCHMILGDRRMHLN
jgi:hypothetical protein